MHEAQWSFQDYSIPVTEATCTEDGEARFVAGVKRIRVLIKLLEAKN